MEASHAGAFEKEAEQHGVTVTAIGEIRARERRGRGSGHGGPASQARAQRLRAFRIVDNRTVLVRLVPATRVIAVITKDLGFCCVAAPTLAFSGASSRRGRSGGGTLVWCRARSSNSCHFNQTNGDNSVMTLMLYLIIACGVLSIVYGVVTTRAVLASDPGSARMQEIAAAIQEGAACLSRAPIHDDRRCRRRHLSHPRLSARAAAGHRLCHRRRALGRRRLYRHERIGARQCAHGAGRHQEPRRRLEPRLPRRRHHRPARCRPRSARRLGLFPHPHLGPGL